MLNQKKNSILWFLVIFCYFLLIFSRSRVEALRISLLLINECTHTSRKLIFIAYWLFSMLSSHSLDDKVCVVCLVKFIRINFDERQTFLFTSWNYTNDLLLILLAILKLSNYSKHMQHFHLSNEEETSSIDKSIFSGWRTTARETLLNNILREESKT